MQSEQTIPPLLETHLYNSFDPVKVYYTSNYNNNECPNSFKNITYKLINNKISSFSNAIKKQVIIFALHYFATCNQPNP